ncbi:MAG TPA: SAM-dependent methyltransferase [Pseudonocardia sp.]|nr:SAM-dependent methyltransferase [Pseudonocardia sp.]
MTQEQAPDIRFDVPHGARIWNYWLGGKDNYPADREIGDAVRAAYPAIAEYAVKSRQFLIRAVRYLAAEAGIRQFLDVGTGLPTMQNTHEVAQGVAPEARVVYVDNDPLVLTHARALLQNTTSEGATTYVDADYRDPGRIVSEARGVLDFDRPIAVLFMGVFGYVTDPDEVRSVIGHFVDAVPPGSYLALWDGTDTSEVARIATKAQADMGSPYELRSVEQIAGWFEGLEMVEPGLVPVTQWRPDPCEVGQAEPIDAYGAVARKP